MSKIHINKANEDFTCDFCDNPDTIANIVVDSASVEEMEICRSCAMSLVHGLKTKITNDLLGIKDEEEMHNPNAG